MLALGMAPSASAQTLTISSVSGSAAQVARGTIYTNKPFLSATGGTAPYTFTLDSTLPAGITLNPDGTLSGITCAANGSYPFDASVTGTGGGTGSLTGINLNVTTAPKGGCSLVFVSGNPPNGSETVAYSTTFAAGGGTAPYTYSIIGNLPDGLTLDTSTGAVTGNPSAGSAGSYTFTVVVVDSAGNTGTATYTVTITATGTLALGPNTIPNAPLGAPYSATFSTAGGVAPITYSISPDPAVPGLTFNTATGQLSGTPTTAGSYTFTVTATDSTGTPLTASRTYTLVVSAAAISPANDTITVPAGVSFSRTYTMTGGTDPIIYSSPNLPTGVSLDASTGTLSGRVRTPGTYVITIIGTDAGGNTATTTVTLIVGARPDPTLDPNVIGLINAQLSASIRFADAQADGIMSRLDSSRDCLKSGAKVTTGQPLPLDFKAENCSEVAVWGAASISTGGNVDANSRFNNPAYTVGVDKRLDAATLVGIAVGYGTDTTKINGGNAESKADFSSVAVYGSRKLGSNLTIDGVLGHLDSSFDSRRWVASESFWLTGSRTGKQFFGRARVSAVQQMGGLRVTPYGYIERGAGTLKGYTESGDDMLALQYNDAKYSYNRLAAGVKVSQRFAATGGAWEPSAKFEQRRSANSSMTQTMSYVDVPGTVYTLRTNPLSQNSSALGLGLTYHAPRGLSATLGYNFTKGSGSVLQRTLGLNVNIPLN